MSDNRTEFICFSDFESIYEKNIMSPEAQDIFSSDLTKHLLSDDVKKRMYCISEKLTENAKKFNLTSILEPSEIVRKHILDSLLPLGIMEKHGILSSRECERRLLADIGCGAGFPSLPIIAASIGYFDLYGMCVDSTDKKIRHVNETIDYIGMRGCGEGITARAEELSSFRGRFDITIARAVSSLPVLIELCAPLTRVGGYFIAMKSHADEEVKVLGHAPEKLGMILSDRVRYSLPGGDEREAVIFKKTKETPAEYPRRYAETVKKPLN